jgi:hypothetical protein
VNSFAGAPERIIPLAGALIAAALWVYEIAPTQAALADAQRAAALLHSTALSDGAFLERARKLHDSLPAHLRDGGAVRAESPGQAALLLDLGDGAQRAGITITAIAPAFGLSEKQRSRAAFHVTVAGSYVRALQFLHDVTLRGDGVSLDTIDIRRGNGDSAVVVKFELSFPAGGPT